MGFFDIFKKKKKMSDGLEKTRTDFFQNIVNTLTSSVIDDDLYNDLEEQLLQHCFASLFQSPALYICTFGRQKALLLSSWNFHC